MTEQKLSKAQAKVVRLMQKWPNKTWWLLSPLNCRRSTVEALERKGYVRTFYDSVNGDRWRLVPEAERVPIPDEDIPF